MENRYSRQIRFSPIGNEGQNKLKQKHVLIIGAGALGTSNAEMLARAGAGAITIVDRDYVEWSNLGRQQLYTEQDAIERLPKAVACERHLKNLNSEIHIKGIIADVTIQEIEALLQKPVDIIIDATDNFETRMLINDAAEKYQIPWIYGACTGSYGMSYTILPRKTPCLSCLVGMLPQSGDTCDTVGVISPAIQMVTAQQTTEALKILTGDYMALRGTLFYFDLWKNEFVSIKVPVKPKSDCPSCGDHPYYPYLKPEHQSKTAVLCGRDTVQIRPARSRNIDLNELNQKFLQLEAKVEVNPFLLNAVIGEKRMVVFKDGRVLIHGTKDIKEARSLYHRYIGG